jgi:hypothetical protein
MQFMRYAVASLAISVVAILWLALAATNLPLPFDAYKQHRIGAAAAVLGLILSFAAHRRTRRRKKTVAAIIISTLAVLAYFLVMPL